MIPEKHTHAGGGFLPHGEQGRAPAEKIEQQQGSGIRRPRGPGVRLVPPPGGRRQPGSFGGAHGLRHRRPPRLLDFRGRPAEGGLRRKRGAGEGGIRPRLRRLDGRGPGGGGRGRRGGAVCSGTHITAVVVPYTCIYIIFFEENTYV